MLKVLFGGEVLMFHHRLVELRKSKRITQEALSIKIGVTRSALSQYELGLRQPDYEIVKKIADYFNVTTDDLLGRETKDTTIVESEADRLFYEEYKSWDEKKKEKYRKVTKLLDED